MSFFVAMFPTNIYAFMPNSFSVSTNKMRLSQSGRTSLRGSSAFPALTPPSGITASPSTPRIFQQSSHGAGLFQNWTRIDGKGFEPQKAGRRGCHVKPGNGIQLNVPRARRGGSRVGKQSSLYPRRVGGKAASLLSRPSITPPTKRWRCMYKTVM